MTPATITLHLLSATETRRIDDVVSFVSADASGSFGIQPGRARFMTLISYGLSHLSTAAGTRLYLACPGGVLTFAGNQLRLSTRRFLCDSDHQGIADLLAGQLAGEEQALRNVKDNLQQLEQALFRRLRTLHRARG
jgi:F-type H+-transporting ATPase subunit epsilon